MRCWLFFVLVLGLSSAAMAATDTIVVTGQRPQERAVLKHRATAFVRAVAANGTTGQYARRSSYCPRVIGLSDPKHVAIVLEKLRDAAHAAGLPDPTPRCAGDLAIVFTDNGDALMRHIERGNPRLFSAVTTPQRRELFDSDRAVRWWYATTAGGADGASKPDYAEIRDGQGVLGANTLPVWTSSLIETNVKITLQGTIIVVDVEKASGFPLDSIAAYTAMVSLVPIKLREDFGDAPSILGIMSEGDRGQARRDLSEWDRAYLKTLYALPANREAWTQRGALVGGIVKSVTP